MAFERYTVAAKTEGASNNGMHPTADTTILKFLLSLGAAGDAGR